MSIVDLHISYGIGLPESCYHKVVGTDGVLNDLGVGTNLKVYLWFKWGASDEQGITKLLISKKNEVPSDYHMVENSINGNSVDGDDSMYISYKKTPNETEITKLCLVLDNSELCIHIIIYLLIASEYIKVEPPLVVYKSEDGTSHSIYLCYSTIKQQIPLPLHPKQQQSLSSSSSSSSYNNVVDPIKLDSLSSLYQQRDEKILKKSKHDVSPSNRYNNNYNSNDCRRPATPNIDDDYYDNQFKFKV